MNLITQFNKFHPSLIIFHLIFLAVFLMNFPFGSFFVGWDALSPEFNFWINFRRAFFAFWQENYGVGTLGGHGFAATLPHTIVTFFLSFLPQSAIRSVFTFLCLYLGGLGMFFLVKILLTNITATVNHKSETKEFPSDTIKDSGAANTAQNNTEKQSSLYAIRYSPLALPAFQAYIPLFAAIFYMLNLGTMQMFYVQLETFIAHFAALPWLFWIVIKLLETPTRKYFLLFFVINFFATLQGFIPSLFVAYLSALGIFLLLFIIQHRFAVTTITKSILIGLLTLAINAYWLIPLAYFQVTRSHVFLNSYNNLTSTPHFIDINKKYGDLANVALLKGYLFDSYELGGFLLKPWIDHHNMILPSIFGYLIFAVIIIGVLTTIVMLKNWLLRAFSGIFLFFFINLATDTPPFSLIPKLLQEISPTYEQAFRTAFTKFSIGVSFSYSIFFAIGLFVLLSFAFHYLKDHTKRLILLGSILLALLYYALPAFGGNFLYKRLMVDIPQSYFQIRDHFKNQPDARIADFPQDCSEGWYAYNWGYFGSGFYWYAIEQPFLARSFDVWSNYNENYYWEITQALREQDYERVDAILNKYQVEWILYDPNVLFCRDQRAFLTHEEFITYIEQSPHFTLAETFTEGVSHPIRLYRNTQNKTRSFVTLKEGLLNIGPRYTWNDTDTAYLTSGDYVTRENNYDQYYPFRSLFTKRNSLEKEFAITTDDDHIRFQTTLPQTLQHYTLSLPPYTELEKSIPVWLYFERSTPTSYELKAQLQLPQVSVDGIHISEVNPIFSLGRITNTQGNPSKVLVNGQEITKTNEMYKTTFYFTLPNKVDVVGSNNRVLLTWQEEEDTNYEALLQKQFAIQLPTYQKGQLTVTIPKMSGHLAQKTYQFTNLEQITPKPCHDRSSRQGNRYEIDQAQQYIRLFSQNTSQCITLKASDIPTELGYLAEIRARHITGNNLKFSISNKNRTTYNDTFLSTEDGFDTPLYYILPPTFQTELGYEIKIQNISENHETTINDFGGIALYPLPYAYLKSLVFTAPSGTTAVPTTITDTAKTEVMHPVETHYLIRFDGDTIQKDNAYLVLSQAYDTGWKAYILQNKEQETRNNALLFGMFPFLFGEELKDHVLINSWENGWQLNNKAQQSNSQTIAIVYLPQYLQFFGFALLPIVLLWTLKKKK